MLYLTSMKRKYKYPKWLLTIFMISVISLAASTIGIIIDLIIFLLSNEPGYLLYWCGISWGLFAFCIWKASKYE